MDSQRQTWLDQARLGMASALGALLESYRPYVKVLVRGIRDRRLSRQLDDSDLIQDAFLEAQRGFAGFQGVTLAEWTAWLRTVVLRAAGKTQRGRVGTQKRDVSREQPLDQASAVAAGDSPSAEAIRHEQAARMAEALGRLPEEMQQVLLARHVDGLSHADIAQQMGRTEGAVRMLYLRALRCLRATCQEEP
jgi:RNA polymerase sigma-70 factor, ECF subfamily